MIRKAFAQRTFLQVPEGIEIMFLVSLISGSKEPLWLAKYYYSTKLIKLLFPIRTYKDSLQLPVPWKPFEFDNKV